MTTRGSDATRGRILVCDDEGPIVETLVELLRDEGYDVEGLTSSTELMRRLKAQPDACDLLILDVQMPELGGIQVIEQLRAASNEIAAIVITAHAASSVAIKAIQVGAYDYIQKPFDIDAVALVVERFFKYQLLTAQVRVLTQRAASRDRMIGDSPAMLEIYKTIGRVALSDASVLVTGETGTGKELAANLLHQNSARRDGPLIKVNCAALPETLIESELFGHEKGAFTGAMALRKGRFEQAHRGTIFLDEVGEISLAVQKKLLRVLQEGEVERVGGTGVVRVDVRVVAATNRDLLADSRKGLFREDLYYRLNVVNLHMPPLRERKTDIQLLVEHFLNKHRARPGAPPTPITEEALDRMQDYDWPGNVRQLQNEIERAVALSQGRAISSQLLSLSGQGTTLLVDIAARVRDKQSLDALIGDVARQAAREALAQSDGDERAAAERLAIEPAALRGYLA